MVEKPLPKTLVVRLRRASPKLSGLLGYMKNIDHRQFERNPVAPTVTNKYGMRVREMNVSRNYPGTELVLKRSHGYNPGHSLAPKTTSAQVISEIRGRVDKHNKRFSSTDLPYVLKKPIAYAVGDDLIAMAKTTASSVNELLKPAHLRNERSKRMSTFLEENKIGRQELMSAFNQLLLNLNKIGSRSNNDSNYLVTGVKEGKIVFTPLVDLE